MSSCAIQINIENCKNACLFCNPNGFTDSDEKNNSAIIIDIYKQAIDLSKKGFIDVEISGHDPIQFKHIITFMTWLRHIGFEQILLLTHGRTLYNLKFVKRLSRIANLTLMIPLYGSQERIHDSVTNSVGSFKETLQGIKNLKKLAPHIQLRLHTLIMKENICDVENILHLFLKLKPSQILVRPAFISINSFSQKSAVPYTSMIPVVRQAFAFCKKNFQDIFVFSDIPSCVFGFYDHHIVNGSVPTMASNYSVPGIHKTEMHGIPTYRLKQKLKICSECTYNDHCDGFLKDYVERFNMEQDVTIKPLIIY